MLDDLGLIPALQWQAREVSRTKDLAVQVQADEVSDDLPDDYKTCVYRLVQEALHNIARHANAKSVDIHLTSGMRDRLLLEIRDDGQGFVPELEKGVGLLGMEERVNASARLFPRRLDGQAKERRFELSCHIRERRQRY